MRYQLLRLELALWIQSLTVRGRWRRRRPFQPGRVYVLMAAIAALELALFFQITGLLRPLGA